VRWPRFKRRDPEKPKKLEGQVAVEGRANGAYLVASTEQSQQAFEARIRGRLQAARLIEASVNPATAAKVCVSTVTGAKYPDDLNDFPDYLDSYDYIPHVARAVDIKQFMIWQMGYDLECEDENSKKTVEQLLTDIEADTVIREGTFAALIFGTMYWRLRKEQVVSLEPLNPMKVGLKLDRQNRVIEYTYEPEFGKKETIKPEEMMALKFRARPWDIFGVSALRRVLPTVKALLFMEEKLPWIARRRADPLLLINIGTKEANVDDDTFKRVKNSMINRNAGEDIFNQNGVIEEIQEIYQSASVGGRQTVEPLLAHFTRNLVAGLGVPEPALGFGGTSTMATAEYQERILEAEVRDYQRAIKRMHEKLIFSLVKTSKRVKLVWRPMKEENKETLSKLLQGEIEHAIVSPEWARQRLGYPEDAGKNVYIDGRLVHPESKQSD
jgi:hypothetical protein